MNLRSNSEENRRSGGRRGLQYTHTNVKKIRYDMLIILLMDVKPNHQLEYILISLTVLASFAILFLIARICILSCENLRQEY